MRCGLVVVFVLAVAGCGRIGFDPFGAADGGGGDGGGDGGDASTAELPAVCLRPAGGAASTVAGALGQSVAINPPYVYFGMADGPHGIQVFDATTTTVSPRGVFRTDSGPAMLSSSNNDVLGITIRNNVAYLATYLGGLVTIDVSDPANPTFLGGVNLPGEAWAIALTPFYAFVANHNSGVSVVNIKTVTAPALITTLPLGGPVNDVHVDGNRLYAVAGNQFHVLDISNPLAPVRTGGVTTGQRLYEVYANGNGYAYIADKPGHQLITISVTGTPAVVDRTPAEPLEFSSIDGNGSRLVVGLGGVSDGGVRVYSLADPAHPTFLGEIAAAAPVFELALWGTDRVAATTYDDGRVQIWDITSCPL